MARKYKIDIFDLDQWKEFEGDMVKLKSVVQSKEFMNYIADKCILKLSQISSEKLGGVRDDDVFYQDIDRYRTNHKVDVGTDVVIISNDTMADLSHVSERTLQNYPDGFSIAKAIEFGTGIYGSENDDPEWRVQVNENRDYNKGWYYEKDGSIRWSKGFGGKFIYYELLEYVKENIANWILEYLFNQI